MGQAETKQRPLISSGGRKESAVKEMRFMLSYYYNIDKKMIKCNVTGDRVMFVIFKKVSHEPVIEDDFVLTGDCEVVSDSVEVAATLSGNIRYYIMVDGASLVIIEIDCASGVNLI